MKHERNILIAFLLNLIFSVFELVGGVLTGSVAIASDAVHDLGDAVSIGMAYVLERMSKKKPDDAYTYGYGRYSVLGGLITTMILIFGSVVVIGNAIGKLVHPGEIHSDGMILFAVAGVVVNFCAAYFTRSGETVNQRAVNLHMLEDVLGWTVVLVGGIIIRMTGFVLLDPVLSIGVAVFILIHSVRNLKKALGILLERAPEEIRMEEVQEHLLGITGVEDVHHMHIWSLDGRHHYATMHLVVAGCVHEVKDKVREELCEHGIIHVTMEVEHSGEHCHEKSCSVELCPSIGHCHHHH